MALALGSERAQRPAGCLVKARVSPRRPHQLDPDRQSPLSSSGGETDAGQVKQGPNPVESWVSGRIQAGGFADGAGREQRIESSEDRLDMATTLRCPGERRLVPFDRSGGAYLEDLPQMSSELV